MMWYVLNICFNYQNKAAYTGTCMPKAEIMNLKSTDTGFKIYVYESVSIICNAR